MEPMNEELLLCQCGNPAHQLILFYDDTPHDPAVYVSVHLSQNRNFFKRLLYGLRYIFFNRRSAYGDFDEVILRPEDADKLQRAVDCLKGTCATQGAFPIFMNPTNKPS
jgi:hypothetical protein